MKLSKAIGLTLTLTMLVYSISDAQPIPAELMMGNKYGSVNFVFGRNFSQTSRFGFFHMNTVQFGINDKAYNDFLMEDLIYVEAVKNFRLAGGVVYSSGGFNTTAGLQYVFGGKKVFILCAPRVNIETNPSCDIMNIIQYKPEINDRIKLYTRLQTLNLFDSGGNLKSYQWMRLGFEIKGLQFGLAVNLDEYGPDPSVRTSYGLFIRKEIF